MATNMQAAIMPEANCAFLERKYTTTSYTNNKEFDKNGFLIVKDMWDPQELYCELPNIRGKIDYVYSNDINVFRYHDVEGQVPGSLSRYWYPTYRKIHTGLRKKLEKIIGKKLYNTYYYDRYYFPGQELTKHVDREACEISVSIHISNNLPDDSKDWSFNIKTPDTYTDSKRTNVLVPGEVVSVYLNPGDGVIYKGCERPHWRDHMPSPRRRKRDILLRRKQPEYYYHQIFFHYVLADGLRSYLKGDIPKLNAVELEP